MSKIKEKIEALEAKHPTWTAEDEAFFVRNVKADMAWILKNEDDFEALSCNDAALLHVMLQCVCGLRDELIAWCEADGHKVDATEPFFSAA
jgi:hypothetical protein